MRAFSRLPVSRAARLAGVGVAIHAHAVAELAAEHLVDRHAVGLAGKVPQRDLDRRDAAALAAVAAELLDAPEEPVDVARVLAEEPALQHQREGLAGAVADLAEADDPLVGVDLQERGRERRADDVGAADVGDAQLGRARMRVDPVEGRFASSSSAAIRSPAPMRVGVASSAQRRRPHADPRALAQLTSNACVRPNAYGRLCAGVAERNRRRRPNFWLAHESAFRRKNELPCAARRRRQRRAYEF